MTESTLLVTDKSVVTPGEVIATGMEYFPGLGTYRQGDNILANQLGLLHMEGKVLKTIPLAGRYLPARNDVVIGKVIDILMSGWRIDLNSPYSAVLPLKDATFDFIKKGADLTEYFSLEDYVVCQITQVTSQNLIDISMKGQGLMKLRGGQFLMVNAAKVARIIGRNGSMVSMVKHATKCQVIVGQNGVVWISGEPQMESVAVNAIRKIEREAHVSGLTENMKAWLESQTGVTLDLEAIQNDAEREAQAEKPRFFARPPRDEAFGESHEGSHEGHGDGGDRPRYDGPRHDGPRHDGPRRFDDRRGGGRFGGGDRGPRGPRPPYRNERRDAAPAGNTAGAPADAPPSNDSSTESANEGAE